MSSPLLPLLPPMRDFIPALSQREGIADAHLGALGALAVYSRVLILAVLGAVLVLGSAQEGSKTAASR